MKKNYFIPGFEPDDIHDMAKSALKQIHDRSVDTVQYYCDEPISAEMCMQVVNLNDEYQAFNGSKLMHEVTGLSIDYCSFHTDHAAIDAHQESEMGTTIHDFDRQLDSANHGNNVVTCTTTNSKS